MKTSAFTLAAAGAVALSATTFAPQSARAADLSGTIAFHGNITGASCDVSITGGQASGVTLSTFLSGTPTIELDDEAVFQFDKRRGQATNVQTETVTVTCSGAVGALDIDFQRNATGLATGVLGNDLSGPSAADNVGVRVSVGTGGGLHVVDFGDSSTVSLDFSGGDTQSFTVGAQFYSSDADIQTGEVKADMGVTITYQ